MATKTFACTKDAFMGQNISTGFSGWNGRDEHLPVGVSAGGTYRYRTLVYFPVDFTGVASITVARLKMTDHKFGTDRHCIQTNPPSLVYARRVTADWGEDGNPGEGDLTSNGDWDWDNMHNHQTTSGQVTKGLTQVDNDNVQTFFITDIVQSWLSGSPNYGVVLINDNENSSSRGVQFFAREFATASRRPVLEFDYVPNTAPNAPTLNAPADGAIVSSLVPTFSITRNDPDVGDYITSVQANVRRGNARYVFSTSTTMANPGGGIIRFNNASQASTTSMALSSTPYGSATFTALQTRLRIASHNDPEKWKLFTTSGDINNSTWHQFTASQIASSGGDFVNGEVLWLFYGTTNRTGLSRWDTGVVSIAGNPTALSFPYGNVGTAQPLESGVVFEWDARTADKGSIWGPYALAQTFRPNTIPNAPVLGIPVPSNDVNDLTPDFTITHSDPDPEDSLAYGYRMVVEVETGPGSYAPEWDSGDVDISGSPVTTISVNTGSLSAGAWHRVKARTKDQNNAWGSYSSYYFIRTHATGTPINLDPSGSETTGDTPTLHAQRASIADVVDSYDLIVKNAVGTTIWNVTNQTTGLASGAIVDRVYAGPALTPGATYKWQIRFSTSTTGLSAYTSEQTFIVNDATVPVFTAPTSPATTLTPTITFSRVATFNRVQYELYPQTSTTANLGSVIFASGTLSANIAAGGLGTQYSAAYGGSPAISWGTTYKIRARVSADAGSTWSNWSGLTTFTTDSSAAPVLTSVGGVSYPTFPWMTDGTPDMVITRSGSETIYQTRILVYDSTQTVLLLDTGWQGSYGGSTTATYTYAGPTLQRGLSYYWTAAYRKTSLSGPTGTYASMRAFRYNALPYAPFNMFPESGHVFSDLQVEGDDGGMYPTFRATFGDPDVEPNGDYPAIWEIVVELSNGTPVDTITVSSGLAVGQNEYVWTAGDAALSVSTDYRWRSRFQDSKGEYGTYSSYHGFKISEAPNGTILTPSDESTLATVNPEVTWTYTGGTQYGFVIDINRADSDGDFIANVFSRVVVSATPSFTIPAGYLKQNTYYRIKLTVWNTDGLQDPSPSTVLVLVLLDPPNPITGLSATTFPRASLVSLNWNTSSLKAGHSFARYQIYRRLPGDVDWQEAGTVSNRSNSQYNDWYAGHGVRYEYRVTAFTTKSTVDIDMESPDDPDGGSFVSAGLDTDVWMFVGKDRSPLHIMELIVEDEDHERVVQQESFETLGNDRKVIIRGFVLGNEGNISTIWRADTITAPYDPQLEFPETVLGRRLIDYLTSNKGPHILKSPFGDVWDVEFQGPKYKWQPVGHLQVDLSWVETGKTSVVSI